MRQCTTSEGTEIFRLSLKINQLRSLWQVHSVSFHSPPHSIHSAAHTNERTGKDLLCWTIQLLCQNIKRSRCTAVWGSFQSRKNIFPVDLNLFKQENTPPGKGSLWDAESLYIGAEVNFVSESWSKSPQIHLLSAALVEHGSWNGCVCSINMCSCFTKGLLVKICIFFFFSSSPSKAHLFILHSFYKHVMNTDPNPTAFLEIWYSWHQISRIKVKHSLSLPSIAIMKWNMVL